MSQDTEWDRLHFQQMESKLVMLYPKFMKLSGKEELPLVPMYILYSGQKVSV